MGKKVYDWDALGPTAREMIQAQRPLSEIVAATKTSTGALQHWMRKEGLMLRPGRVRARRRTRKEMLLDATGPAPSGGQVDLALRVEAQGRVAPVWPELVGKNVTGRLMGDPPPGRTPWA